MAELQRVTRRVDIEAGIRGVAEATAALEKLGKTQDGVAVATDRQERATLSMEKRLESIQRRYDPLYRAQQEQVRLERDLDRARQQGLISLQRQNELLALNAQRNQQAAAAARTHALSSVARPANDNRPGLNEGLSRGLQTATASVPGAGFASSLSGLSLGTAAIAGSVAGIAAAGAAIAKAGDEWTGYTNRLKTAGEDQSTVNKRMDELAQIAMRSRTALSPTVELYAGISKSTADLGKSQSDVARVVETVNKAFALNGSSAATASGAILQLNQAFASGVLRGDEFNSVMEGAPPIARLIAQEFGIAQGDLRKFAEDGKLSADKVFDALLKGSKDIDQQFDQTAMTMSQASTNAGTALQQLGAEMNSVLGISQAMAKGLQGAAGAINGMVGAIRAFGDGRDLGRIQNLASTIQNLEDTEIPFLSGARDTQGLKVATDNLARYREEYNKLVKDRVSGMVPLPEKIMLNSEGGLTTPRAVTTYNKAITDLDAAAKKAALEGMDSLARATAEANERFNERAKVAAKMRADGVENAKVTAYEARSQKLLADEIKNASDASSKGGAGSKSAEDAFNRALITAQGRTRQLEEEAKLSGLAGSSLEAMRLQIELETAAKKRGLEVSEAMAASIQKEVEARRAAAQAVAIGKLDADIGFEREQIGRTSSEQRIASRLRSSGLGLDSAQADAMRLNDTLNETKDLLSGAAKGFLADMRAGKTAAEAFSNVLDQILTKIANKAIDQLISGMFGGFGGGGGFNIFSLLGGFGGGGGLGLTPGAGGLYDKGGYTGAGGRYDPAGIVHKGEYVFSAASVSRLGVGRLDAMHRGSLPGYDKGGFVDAFANTAMAPSGMGGKPMIFERAAA